METAFPVASFASNGAEILVVQNDLQILELSTKDITM